MNTIKLDKEPHNILFNFNSLGKFQSEYKLDPLKDIAKLGYLDWVGLVYEGLKEGNRFDNVEFSLTRDDVGGYMNPSFMREVMGILREDLNLKEVEEGTEKK